MPIKHHEFPKRVEMLAREMCHALNIDPDDTFSHDDNYSGLPIIRRGEDRYAATHAIALRSPNWVSYAWEAQLWIYTKSGGELP